MASFAQNLWESIFTPGPTPTLLVATNATFVVLQVLLAALLAATYSVHFLVLSVLCGGLWAAINWFARELREYQQQEEEKEKKEKERSQRRGGQGGVAAGAASGLAAAASSSADDSETEVEGAAAAGKATGSRRGKAGLRPSGAAAAAAAAKAAPADVAVSTVVEPAETRGEVKLRTVQEVPSPSPSQGHKSGVSTEDEWEKVSENEKDK